MTQIYQELAGLWVSDSVRSLGDSADSLKSDFQATRQIQYILRIGVRVQGSHGLLQLTLFFSILVKRLEMFKSSGPIPSIGEITPPKT